MPDIKDFTRPVAEPRMFKIDDDIFEAAADVPAGCIKLFTKMFKADPADQYDMLAQMLDLFLLPESAERFAARMEDQNNPITLGHISDVIAWLMEEFGGRPTKQSKASVRTRTRTGTNSTDGAPVKASTP